MVKDKQVHVPGPKEFRRSKGQLHCCVPSPSSDLHQLPETPHNHPSGTVVFAPCSASHCSWLYQLITLDLTPEATMSPCDEGA